MISKTLHDPLESFSRIRATESRGIYASEGLLYNGAIFGRDSLEVAQDLIGIDDKIPREVIHTLAALQGVCFDPVNEEEVGKIHHEHRRLVDIDPIDSHALRVYQTLYDKWGGKENVLTYYGSVDATPLFVKVIRDYTRNYGKEILADRVTGRDGIERSVAEHTQLAINWILDRIQQSTIGFLEYKRLNPVGIENQIWKDSATGLLQSDGSLLDHSQPIAPLEVQAYAYDALECGLELSFDVPYNETFVDEFKQKIIDSFWLIDKEVFSSAIDRDKNGKPRVSNLMTSSMGLVLDSDLLIGNENKDIVTSIVKSIMSDDFLCKAGIRCRPLSSAGLVNYPDYHGAYAVWFKESSDIARGLELHGYHDEALSISEKIVDTIVSLGEYYEFVFVDENNSIIHPTRQFGRFSDARVNVPEPGQAWTMSAFVCALARINSDKLSM